MSNTSDILHRENIPNEGFLLLPSRLDYYEVLQLEKVLAGRSIVWLCEVSCAGQLDPLIVNHLDRDGTEAISF